MPKQKDLVLRGKLPDGREIVELTLRGRRIAKLKPTGKKATAKTPLLSPGLVDIQVNGWLGRSLNSDAVTAEDVGAIARALLHEGTTRFVPTLVTGPFPRMLRACRAVAEACERGLDRGAVLGLHLEGPYLSPEDGPRGAHNRDWMHDPSWSEFRRLREAAGGRVIYVTLAPERRGALKFISRLAAAGIMVALGHHQANKKRLAAAVAAGARFCTHLGNGSHPLLPRLDNYVWTQLAEDRLHAGFIADGHHLPDEALKCMLRAKGLARAVFISDAAALAGLPPGVYHRPPNADKYRVLPSGKITVVGREALAGSSLSLRAGVAGAVRAAGLSWSEAFSLASARPVEVLKNFAPAARLPRGLGTLKVGAPADVVLFRVNPASSELTPLRVFRNGEEEDLSRPLWTAKEKKEALAKAGNL